MESLLLKKIDGASGSVNLPGSKSLSNRALLLAAVAEGRTELTNLLDSDDVRRMLEALTALGVNCRLSEDRRTCRIQGLAGAFRADSRLELFLGNAGTAMRPLAAVLSMSRGSFVLTGEPRMYERPIAHLVDALRQIGADIRYPGAEGYPPLEISGRPLEGERMRINGTVSSQYLTAALMAAPLLGHELTIEIEGELVSRPYIDITLKLMADFGVSVENREYRSFFIAGGQKYRSPGSFLVEGDASGASYFLAAGAIAGSVTVTGLGGSSIQGDLKFTEVLRAMGARVVVGDDFVTCSSTGELKGVNLDLNRIPDAAMTVATLALFAKGPTVIRNIGNWRVKETDRIAAMARELRKLGAEVEEGADYLRVEPKGPLHPAVIDTYNDHRMAMCFSLAAFGTELTINDPGCTRKTFPEYFMLFDEISVRH
ncbi:MAG: 3-phosphoshikimate 1-carboxyvinyltransferase [Succinivibrionaceae bacterium]|nr:3-phosphoshikimate 1-carboxyvinyltransferase [Succinivibrionaceae bacterium]